VQPHERTIVRLSEAEREVLWTVDEAVKRVCVCGRLIVISKSGNESGTQRRIVVAGGSECTRPLLLSPLKSVR
jgi:hypothetical protein